MASRGARAPPPLPLLPPLPDPAAWPWADGEAEEGGEAEATRPVQRWRAHDPPRACDCPDDHDAILYLHSTSARSREDARADVDAYRSIHLDLSPQRIARGGLAALRWRHDAAAAAADACARLARARTGCMLERNARFACFASAVSRTLL